MTPPDFVSTLQQALSLQLGGNIAAAEALYRGILTTNPNQADACYLLGQLCRQAGRLDEATNWLSRAAEHAPEQIAFHLAVGELQLESGQPHAAIDTYRRVLARKPDTADALFGLGCAFIDLRNFDQALMSLQTAIVLSPGNGSIWGALGELALRRGELLEAEKSFRAARATGLDSAELANNLGITLNGLHRYDEAISEFELALVLKEVYPEAAMNLGNALREQGDVDGAWRSYKRALNSKSSDCLRIRMATLFPPVYGSRDEMLAYRARYESNLDELLAENLTRCDPIADGGAHNFYLCYQGLNDRDLQSKLARLYRKLHCGTQCMAHKPRSARRIRVGFVSAFFTDHTIGHLNRGIIAGLDRSQFEVFVFSVGGHGDHMARAIEAGADHYHAFTDRRLHEAETIIARCELDVLFYPDIGMEPFTYFLAFSRLAPVQCVTWGHPVTTGIDTIDYFISSVHQEPEGAETHYSEKLVKLSVIPAYFHCPPRPVLSRDRASFGLSDQAHLYLCPQSLFKFHPDFDLLIAGILASDPVGEVLIPEGHRHQWTEALQARFQRTMPHVIYRIRWLPRQAYDDYLQLMLLSDVMLDPMHFGGGKTTLDALSLGVPIVTLPGKFMRGRATLACYRQMGMSDCIAANASAYIRIATELANDVTRRSWLSESIAAQSRLLGERSDMIWELEQFFISAVESAEKG